MKRVAIGCAVFVLLFVVVLGLAVAVSRYRSGVRSGTWLELDLEGSYPEYRPPTLIAALTLQDTLLLRDLTDALDRAAEDPKIAGVVARIGDLSTGLADTQEIRDHVSAFRKSGKPAICYLETAGEFGAGNIDYLLASAFDKIYLGPSGDINLTGLMSSSLFLRGTFDKLEIYPDMEHIGDYKTAMNMYTEKAYTPAHREMVEQLLKSVEKTMTATIAEGRGISETAVRALLDHGPFIGQEALEAKLVDGMKYRDEVFEELKKSGEKKARTVKPQRYLKSGGLGAPAGSTVAVVYGVGPVTRGKSEMDPIEGTTTMGSDSVAKSLRQAAEDDSVKAIVFRVDSPGGSYVASDIIWREVVRAKEKKPVVVSMSDVAGSGGYFVAMSASEIVAEPCTITASIGVLGGKLDAHGFYNKLGLTKDHISLHPFADMYYDYQRFTPQQKETHWKFLRRIYDDFSHKVAKGRNMKWEDVDRIGRGRVWTGSDAKDLGLVDHLGGLEIAIARAKELAKIPVERKVRLKIFPQEKSVWQALTSRDEEGDASVVLRSFGRLAAAIRQIVRAAGVSGEESVLMMRDVPEIR